MSPQSWTTVFLFCVLMTHTRFVTVSATNFAVIPEDTATGQGCLSVQLNCTIVDVQSDVYWLFEGITITKNNESYYASSYIVTGDTALGEYNIVILTIGVIDEGEYTCQHSTPLIESSALLTVELLCSYIDITVHGANDVGSGGVVYVPENSNVLLQASVDEICNQSYTSIIWFNSTGNSVIPNKDPHFILPITVRYYDNDDIIFATPDNEATQCLDVPQTDSVSFNVSYSPKYVNMDVTCNADGYALINCSSDANPDEIDYKINIDESTYGYSTVSIMQCESTNVTCQATNDIGTSSTSIKVGCSCPEENNYWWIILLIILIILLCGVICLTYYAKWSAKKKYSAMGVRVTGQTETSLTVLWLFDDNGNNGSTTFNVLYKKENTPQFSSAKTKSPPYIIKQLEPSTTYVIYLKTNTLKYISQDSETITAKTVESVKSEAKDNARDSDHQVSDMQYESPNNGNHLPPIENT